MLNNQVVWFFHLKIVLIPWKPVTEITATIFTVVGLTRRYWNYNIESLNNEFSIWVDTYNNPTNLH